VDQAQLQERIADGAARAPVLGLPTYRNSSFIKAPLDAPSRIADAIRREESNHCTETGLDLSRPGTLRFLGDLTLEAPDDFERIRAASSALFGGPRAALFLGGDHSVTFPILAGLHERLGPVDVVHIDAHPDLYDDYEGNPLSHASPFARALERGFIRTLHQFGIRTLNAHQRAQVERFGVRCHEMRDRASWPPLDVAGPVYVTVDLDGLDPSCAPGVSHWEPGGLTVREALDVIHSIQAPVVGGDVVEYNTARDPQGITAVVAARIAMEILGLALRGSPPVVP
jgi:agmatinase